MNQSMNKRISVRGIMNDSRKTKISKIRGGISYYTRI